MQHIKCPACGHEIAVEARAAPPAANGAAVPPEVATWKIERLPPEMLEEARRTFSMEEYLEQERELLKTGGGDIDAVIKELERRLHDGS